MADNPTPQLNRNKIRLGLALISIVVAAAVALAFVIDAPAGRAVMFAIAATGFIRMFLLSRSLRHDRQ